MPRLSTHTHTHILLCHLPCTLAPTASGAKTQGSAAPGAGAWGDIVSIPPLFNRLVVFTNTNRSIHGHPNPLATPLGTPLRSPSAPLSHPSY